MFKNLFKAFYFLLLGVFIFQSTGCGTLLYPERRGQRGGHVDVGVALLDGIGLLFFLIPGVIAFAVDFSNGTIYLPGGSLRSSLDLNNIKQVKFDPKHGGLADVERIIKEQTGYVVKFDQSNMRIVKLKSTSDMMVQFAQVLPGLRDDRLSLVR
jgi:hypothetical protein